MNTRHLYARTRDDLLRRIASRSSISGLLLLIVLHVFTPAVHADEALTIGQPIPAISATDQHDEPYTFNIGTRFLLLAFDMDTSKVANRMLAERGAEFLDAHAAAYAIDIHGMPGIGRVFALPRMRKYPHRIILLDDPDLSAVFPQATGQLTRLSLDEAGIVTAVDFINPSIPAADWFTAE